MNLEGYGSGGAERSEADIGATFAGQCEVNSNFVIRHMNLNYYMNMHMHLNYYIFNLIKVCDFSIYHGMK